MLVKKNKYSSKRIKYYNYGNYKSILNKFFDNFPERLELEHDPIIILDYLRSI